MAALGTCLQVLTASNLLYAVHKEPVLIAVWRQQKRKKNWRDGHLCCTD